MYIITKAASDLSWARENRHLRLFSINHVLKIKRKFQLSCLLCQVRVICTVSGSFIDFDFLNMHARSN